MSLPDALAKLWSGLMPRRLRVEIGVASLHVRKMGTGGRAGAEIACIPLASAAAEAATWQAGVHTLKAWLSSQGPGAVAMQIVLSDRYARYQHLPWRPGMSGEREWNAFAIHRFREVFGELAGQWRIALSDGGPGKPRVACAIDAALLKALQALASDKVTVASVQTMFIDALNRSRRQCKGRRFWFAHLEAGRLCVGMVRDGQCAAIRNESSEERWPAALATISRRLALAAEDEGEQGKTPLPFYVCGDLQGMAAPAVIDMAAVRVVGGSA